VDVEVMPWDRGLLACAAAPGDPCRNPQVLPAVLVDLAVRGELHLVAEDVDSFRIQVTPGPGGGLRPDELGLRNLIGGAAATLGASAADGLLLDDLRRDPVFGQTWPHLLGQVARAAGAAARSGRRGGDSGADGSTVAFGVRLIIGVGSIGAGAVGWGNPAVMSLGALGLAAAVLIPDARPRVVRGKSLASDLEEIDRSVLAIASTGASRIDRTAYERALPIGILLGRNLNLWAVLADGAYPDGCPWLTPGEAFASPTTPPTTPPTAPAAPGPRAGTDGAGTDHAGTDSGRTGADGERSGAVAAAPDDAQHGEAPAGRPVPALGALLRSFCLEAARPLPVEEEAAPARP